MAEATPTPTSTTPVKTEETPTTPVKSEFFHLRDEADQAFMSDDHTLLEFYKNGVNVFTSYVYKYLEPINVTVYDRVDISAYGFSPNIDKKVSNGDCRIKVSQSYACFKHTMDLTDVSTFKLISDVFANKAIDRMNILKYDSTSIESEEEDEEEGEEVGENTSS